MAKARAAVGGVPAYDPGRDIDGTVLGGRRPLLPVLLCYERINMRPSMCHATPAPQRCFPRAHRIHTHPSLAASTVADSATVRVSVLFFRPRREQHDTCIWGIRCDRKCPGQRVCRERWGRGAGMIVVPRRSSVIGRRDGRWGRAGAVGWAVPFDPRSSGGKTHLRRVRRHAHDILLPRRFCSHLVCTRISLATGIYHPC